MAKKESKPFIKTKSMGFYLANDVLVFMFSIFPGAAAWGFSFYFTVLVQEIVPFPLVVLAFPLVLTLLFIAICFSIRALLPSLKPGVYDLGHPATRNWYCHFLLGNALYVAGLQPLVYGSQIFKFLYWRAMGAKVEFGIICNHLTRIRDFQLLEMGRGLSLSADTHIACHTYVGNRLLLGKVKLGRDAFLGMQTVVGPRTIVEEGAWVGGGNHLFREHIKAGERVETMSMQLGNPDQKYEKD